VNEVDRVRLLLLSRYDYLPSPRISRVYSGAEPGPQASRYVPCENCAGCGRVRNRLPCLVCSPAHDEGRPIVRPRHGCKMCQTCDGRGERKRRRGEAQHDTYSGLPLEDAVRAREEDELKRAPRRWKGTGAPDLSEDPTWRRKAAYEAQGSYEELDRQLEWLSLAYRGRYEMLMHWVSSRDDQRWAWSEQAERGVHDTIVLLARRMAKPIRVPNWVRAAMRVQSKDAA